jgi:hypothetical protein
VLNREQRATFERRGLLQLSGQVDASVVGALRERIAAHLHAQRLVPDPPPEGFAVFPSLTSSVTEKCRFEELWGASTLSLLDDLLGAGRWQPPSGSGQILPITFPLEGVPWSLPHKVWHLDYTAPAALEHLPGVQLFLCVDRVERHGGGTLVVCGTHRLVDAIRRRERRNWPGRSADVRKRLKAASPWLRELASVREGEDREARFTSAPTPCGDAELQVVELVGEPGDVFAMHPWLLHAPAPNCGARPRLVVTERLRTVGL